jgi:hypothetical protein
MNDYIKFYHLENYILTEVNENFRKNGYLNSFDFFCIVIWKANRAKSKVAKRLLKYNSSLEEGVKELTQKIYKASDDKEKLKILVKEYKFRLPMASSVLAILYPDTFTIYDVRVCDTLVEYKKLGGITDFEKIWSGYKRYTESVVAIGTQDVSLRNKDRMLWGKSFYEQLTKDLTNDFE